jgi:two-component system response regulator HydG
MQNAERRTLTKTCDTPFERGPLLCSVCRMAPEIDGLRRCSRMVVDSPVMRALMMRAAQIAASEAPVVILGESGTGKEVLARAIHANSPRKRKPFVAVNVAALPAELLESELFGHAKGAFTGAVAAHRGLMSAADGGTLLLDEIADMPLLLQAKLLRALETGEVRPVGDTRATRVDLRVLCATNGDLARHVEEGRFRADLYYRLKVFALRLPPLRERVEDIEPLVRAFLEGAGSELAVSKAAWAALEAYAWPGNIRELSNAILHATTLCTGDTILPAHLPEELFAASGAPRGQGPLGTLEEVERDHIGRVLEACNGNRAEAARMLGIGRNTLWRKLRAYGFDGQ